jgi:hypothetical protein
VLRGHVGGRADASDLRLIDRGHQRRAEVGNLDIGFAGGQDVRRFDIPVCDAQTMREIERPGAFENDFDDLVDGQQVVLAAEGLQRPARHVFHDDVGKLVTDHGVEYLHDVGVIELARQRCFGNEKLARQPAVIGLFQLVLGHHLDRDFA